MNYKLSAGLCMILFKVISGSTSSSTTTEDPSVLSSLTSSLSLTISPTGFSIPSLTTDTSSTIPLPSTIVGLPTQVYNINQERPKMINQINTQRSGLQQPLLCQDSLLTSIAQQHANDMAVLDDLDHNLPCNSDAYPAQFCKASVRLAPYGQAGENIISLAGNDGSASAAMGQFNADSSQFSTMMNPDFLYVGVGMAMNLVSGKYYWVQVYSAGNFQGVSCTLTPSVTVLNALNQTTTTVQPSSGLNLAEYPEGISESNNNNQNLFCTLVPFNYGTSTLPLGKLPYPTITLVPSNSSSVLSVQASGVIMAFNSALSAAGASIVGPSSIPMIAMQILPSSTTTSSSTSTSTTPSLTTSSLSASINLSSMMYSFKPTNSAQSSAYDAMSSMMTNPTMASMALQMNQFMMMATANATSSTTTSA